MRKLLFVNLGAIEGNGWAVCLVVLGDINLDIYFGKDVETQGGVPPANSACR